MSTTIQPETAQPDTAKPKKTKFEIPKRRDTFSEWLETQRIPVVRGFYIEDINTVELEYWDLKGVPASFVILDGQGGVNDAYICEIPPGGKSKPIHHMYEEMVYVTKGHGATTVWQKDGRKHTFEWGPGSLFAIPMNAYYQHFNSSGVEGARYYAVTNSCFMMNLFHNVDFIFGNEYAFTDRFDPSTADYFSGEGKIEKRLFMTTNFVPDANSIKLYDYSERGKGGTNVKFNFAQQSMGCHISEFPVGSYKKGHRHGPGAHLIILNGQGFSTMWSKEGAEPKRVPWKPRTVVVPPDQWLHQHFNTGSERVRYLAMHQSSWAFKPLVKGTGDLEGSLTSVKDGGNQIEFEDEDPSIHTWFVDELHKSGAECVMCDYFPNCPKKC
jgi:mannose-6-phosphate isomerase-like protein (cupin superfamily)